MDYFTTHTFISRHGWQTFELFCQMINSGATLKEISSAINLSASQICRYREILFYLKYIPKIGTKRYIEEYAEKDLMRGKNKETFILKLVNQ